MQVFRGIPKRAAHGCVLTIGNFDGVHRGHQALLAKLTEKAQATGLPSAVLTFEPHPREYFTHENRPRRLTSLREKIRLLEAQGVDRLYIGRFNAGLAGLTAEQFIEDVLCHGLGVRHVLIGDDFRFGKGRQGDFAMLQAAGKKVGFGVESMHTVDHEGERVSSSAVRAALADGEIRLRLALGPSCLKHRYDHFLIRQAGLLYCQPTAQRPARIVAIADDQLHEKKPCGGWTRRAYLKVDQDVEAGLCWPREVRRGDLAAVPRVASGCGGVADRHGRRGIVEGALHLVAQTLHRDHQGGAQQRGQQAVFDGGGAGFVGQQTGKTGADGFESVGHHAAPV